MRGGEGGWDEGNELQRSIWWLDFLSRTLISASAAIIKTKQKTSSTFLVEKIRIMKKSNSDMK